MAWPCRPSGRIVNLSCRELFFGFLFAAKPMYKYPFQSGVSSAVSGHAQRFNEMIFVGQVRKGAYFDSVTLMQCGKALAGRPGVVDAAIVMGTSSNRTILEASGLLLPDFAAAGDADLLVALKAETQADADAALGSVDAILAAAGKRGGDEQARAGSLEGALKLLPDANLALISVAGRYAGGVAREALEQGLHVMLFSDNVPLETEIELKRLAAAKGLLVMGPDCGTAIINGVPLAFANVVARGDIGIVAAAGTGLQEVSTLISNAGGGISQAIGTGGRDVKKAVGGVTFLAGLRVLAEYEQTKVIVLVSKPPDAEVLATIQAARKQIAKPVIAMFVGAPEPGGPRTLEMAALMAVAASQGQPLSAVCAELTAVDRQLQAEAAVAAAQRRPGQKYLRGLFSGGTFCSEAQAILLESKLHSTVYSNVPLAGVSRLSNSLRSERHTVIDLGEDEFTQGRPHPMIDFTLRNRRILEEAADPETAVILLDLILGFGAHPDPAGEIAEVIRQASQQVMVVCSVTGTDQDPQVRSAVKARLEEAGAVVLPSNAAAARLAAFVVQSLEGAGA
jgi:succinyl-CoA synthetase alpha subunit